MSQAPQQPGNENEKEEMEELDEERPLSISGGGLPKNCGTPSTPTCPMEDEGALSAEAEAAEAS
jgi:hypothetical protein